MLRKTLAAVVLLSAAGFAFGQGGTITHWLQLVDNAAGNGDPTAPNFNGGVTHFTVDLVAEVVNDDWTATAGTGPSGALFSLDAGTFWEHPLGGNRQPAPAMFAASPALRFDSFYTTPEGWPNVPGQGRRPAFAGPLVNQPQVRRATWFTTPPGAGPGTFTLARFAVQLNPGEAATFRARGYSSLAGAPGGTEFDESIVVPEPSTLMLSAFGGLLVIRRR